MELEQDRDALSRLQRIMQLDPSYGNKKVGGPAFTSGVVYPLIGSTLQNLGKPGEALKFYEDYLRKFPEGSQAGEIRRLVQSLKRRSGKRR